MSSADSVRVVVHGSGEPIPAGTLSAALAAEGVMDPHLAEPRLTPAVCRVAETGCRWVWLLASGVMPRPGALRALLAAARDLAPPAPVLLAGKVLDESGRLHPDSLPRHEVFEKEQTVEAAARRLVHLRVAAPGSVLVAAEAVRRALPPRADLPPGLDMREWSARLLRRPEDRGYLVPTSVAVRRDRAAAVGWNELAGRLRMLSSPAWTPSERLWESFVLAQDAVASLRAVRSQGRDGVGAPGRHPSSSPRRMTGAVRGAKRLKRR